MFVKNIYFTNTLRIIIVEDFVNYYQQITIMEYRVSNRKENLLHE